jgi:hypothetical protein
VQTRDSREPWPSGLRVADRVAEEALQRGVVTYPGHGSVDGTLGDHLKLAPPLIIGKRQIDKTVDALTTAIRVVEAQLSAQFVGGEETSGGHVR